MLDKILKPFTYWIELYRDIKMFNVFRNTAYEHKKMLSDKHDLRVDWLGRIYGVINIPEEVEGAAEQIQQAYVLQQITKYGSLMSVIGLADIVFPEISKIEGSPAYLVVLWPVYDALNIWYILGNLIRTSLVLTIFIVLIRIIISNFNYLSEYVTLTLESLKSIM